MHPMEQLWLGSRHHQLIAFCTDRRFDIVVFTHPQTPGLIFAAVLLSTSNRRIALSLWRLVALLLGLWVVSLGASEQAAKSSPVSARAASTYQRGMKALQKGDLATAQAEFEKVIRLTPRSAEGHNSLGWVLLSQRQFESAISQFRTAVRNWEMADSNCRCESNTHPRELWPSALRGVRPITF